MKESIPWVMVGLIWALNFAISWWNARTVGLFWVESKVMGGWTRLMSWAGAIMSASGFTWCYLIILLFGAYYAQPFFLDEGVKPILDESAIAFGFSLGYLIIIPGVLITGLMIWIDSIVTAWKQRTIGSVATAGWNTYAQIHNTYSAMRGMPEAFASVKNFFSSDSDSDSDDDDAKSKAILVVIVLIIVAIIGGIMTTWSIINHYAGTRKIDIQPKGAY